jgi:hypothetical protein
MSERSLCEAAARSALSQSKQQFKESVGDTCVARRPVMGMLTDLGGGASSPSKVLWLKPPE